MNQLRYETPLLPFLLPKNENSKREGPQFLMKYEFMQPGGSFKTRGISYLIEKTWKEASPDEIVSIFSSSGGNAGLAAARASSALSLPCTVVVPKLTKKRMIEKISDAGAKVIIHGEHWKEADNYLREELLIDEPNMKKIYVHPFDDPVIWEGHSIMIDEIIEQLRALNIPVDKVKGIVCSVGGGGLYSGIARGLEKHQLQNSIPIYAIETEGCEVLNKSLLAGQRVVLDKISSVATSLGSTEIAENCFEKAKSLGSKSIVLEDHDVVSTCLNFLDDTGILVEPACGASVHLAYNPELLGKLDADAVFIVIVCGGSCATYEEIKGMLN